MACPGGCIGGGGQPRVLSKERDNVLAKRRQAVFKKEENCVLRRSHESPVVKELYDQWLAGAPGSPTAHELLHTSYISGGPEEFKTPETPKEDNKGIGASKKEAKG
jgi:NADP-reducing hydrogenase subunit HndD